MDEIPQSFEVEIVRDKLERFYRLLWGLIAFLPLCALGAAFGLAAGIGPKDRQFDSAFHVLTSAALGCGCGLIAGGIIAAGIYVAFVRKNAKREAESLQVLVEGPFLRIREGAANVRDRRLHFNAIVDYTYFQNPLMRICEVEGIKLTTMAGGQDSSISIRGVKDAMNVRDVLSEVDAVRENR